MKKFLPPERILLGPGPSNIYPEVLEAMSRSTVGHLDPQFIILMDEIKFQATKKEFARRLHE